MRPRVLCLLVLCLLRHAPFVLAQDAAEWRGAWLSAERPADHVLYLVAHPDGIGGTWCNDCANPDSLAFVDDGRSTESGLHFNLYYARADGSSSVVPARARLADGALYLELDAAQGEATSYRLVRGPAWSAPQNTLAPASPPAVRTLPGRAEKATPESVAGLWLYGSGPRKQYFIIKRHKDTVRGLVCGPCSDPLNFAPLENFRFDGDRVHFDIVHEDNGFGFLEHGPFRNVTVAQVAGNEMQLSTYASFEPDGRRYELTLLGPVEYREALQP